LEIVIGVIHHVINVRHALAHEHLLANRLVVVAVIVSEAVGFSIDMQRNR
jgi:hypothetical protein